MQILIFLLQTFSLFYNYFFFYMTAPPVLISATSIYKNRDGLSVIPVVLDMYFIRISQ